MTEKLVGLITDLTREMLDAEGQPVEGIGPDTRLFGTEGLLDSMGVVSLIVAVEQALEDEYGVAVALADGRALSQSSSPYRTIETLAEYASTAVAASR